MPNDRVHSRKMAPKKALVAPDITRLEADHGGIDHREFTRHVTQVLIDEDSAGGEVKTPACERNGHVY